MFGSSIKLLCLEVGIKGDDILNEFIKTKP